MSNLNDEEIEFLISMAQWLIDDGMANYTHEDYDKLKEIREKWEK